MGRVPWKARGFTPWMARSAVFGDLSAYTAGEPPVTTWMHGMDADAAKPLVAFGFLTIVESADHGLFGGYLVLSVQGRPLEFRCSTPIVPSRAQEILYGPTLRPYLFAEVIGAALVESASLSVQAILVDLPDVLPIALLQPETVCCVCSAGGEAALEGGAEVGAPRLRMAEGFESRLDAAAELLAPLAQHIDLAEPFERIRAALAEAQAAPSDAEERADEIPAAA